MKGNPIPPAPGFLMGKPFNTTVKVTFVPFPTAPQFRTGGGRRFRPAAGACLPARCRSLGADRVVFPPIKFPTQIYSRFLDRQDETACFNRREYPHFRCAGVLDGIVQRLLESQKYVPHFGG